MANTKLPARLLDTSAVPALNVTGNLTVDTSTLVVDSSNNRVGIGTASPAQALTVQGRIVELNNSGIQVVSIQASSDHGQIVLNQSGGVARTLIHSQGDSYFTGGNLGIGESSPSGKLHLSSANADHLYLERSGHDTFRIALSHSVGLGIYNVTDSRQDVMIDGSGRVGIGTTSPGSPLEIKSSATNNAGGLRIIQDSGSNLVASLFGGVNSGTRFGRLELSETSGDAINVRLSSDPSLTSYINAGNVGIGDTSPSAIRLSVVTPTANHVGLQVENSNTADSFGMVVKGGNDANDYTADFRKRDNTSIMRILGDGTVGIGTGAPNGELEVNKTNSGDLGGRIVIRNGSSTSGSYCRLYLSPTANDPETRGTLIQGENVDGNNNMAMVFKVSAGDSPAERMRLKSNGYVDMAGASDVRVTIGSQGTAGTNDANWIRGEGTNHGHNTPGDYYWEVSGNKVMRLDADGLRFGTDTAAANALDDYEEGSWTPTATTSDSNSSISVLSLIHI